MTLNSLLTIKDALSIMVERYEEVVENSRYVLNFAKDALEVLENAEEPNSDAIRQQSIEVAVREDSLREAKDKLRAYTTALAELNQTDFR